MSKHSVTAKATEVIKANKAVGFQPGNRYGAKENMPRGRWITRELVAQLQEEMDDPDFDPKDRRKVRERRKAIHWFCKTLIRLAIGGDTTAIKMVMDRIEGTPIQTVQWKDVPDGAETPEQMKVIEHTRQQIENMDEKQLEEAYRASVANSASLGPGSRTSGSA